MKPGVPLRASFEYEIFEPGDPPKRGDTYKDPHGRTWRVTEVRDARTTLLRNPPPPYPGFRVTLEADHGAYRLAWDDVLVPTSGKRYSGPGWSGRVFVDKQPTHGFGEVEKNGAAFSWLFRIAHDGTWSLKVGPRVEQMQQFAGGVHAVVEPVQPEVASEDYNVAGTVVGHFITTALEAWRENA